MKNEKAFLPYFLIFIVLIPIGFFLSFDITENIVLKKVNNTNTKYISEIVEKSLKQEFVKKNYRFTTFFSADNSSFISTEINYRNSYNHFKNNQNNLYKNIDQKIKYIIQNFQQNNLLPAFLDRDSDFVFFPIAYLKDDSIKGLEDKIKDIFKLKYQDIDFRREIIKDSKILNYIFIEFKENKNMLILISSAFDSDPLYPNNRRILLQISYDKNNISDMYVKTFTIIN